MLDAVKLAASNGALIADPGLAAPMCLRGLSVSYGGQPVVFSVDMTVQAGRMTAIIGPNGAGKSSLLKAALNVIPALSGQVSFFGQPLDRARSRIAYVPQRASVDWEFPVQVRDVVMMGLTRELGLIQRIRGDHRARVAAALDRVGMADFATRQIGQLSGGQQQRVFLARALAQGADLFLLDEPFAGVDAATERAIVDVLHDLRDEGRTVVSVHHDLSTVPIYFDDVFLINRRKMGEGPVAQAFTRDVLAETYGGRLGDADMTALALRT